MSSILVRKHHQGVGVSPAEQGYRESWRKVVPCSVLSVSLMKINSPSLASQASPYFDEVTDGSSHPMQVGKSDNHVDGWCVCGWVWVSTA